MQLTRSMFELGKVKTTIAKAKAVQPLVEKLITKAKSASSSDIREIQKTVSDSATEKRLLEMAKTRFTKRNSGYTRIVKLGKRVGDSSEMVYLEFVDAAPVAEKTVKAEKAPKAAEKQPKVEEAEVVQEEAPKKTARTKKTTK